jgi:hypothetical protein
MGRHNSCGSTVNSDHKLNLTFQEKTFLQVIIDQEIHLNYSQNNVLIL